MAAKRLQEHYDRKYSHENTQTSIEPIAKSKIPINRYEAVVKYFPKYFKGGKIIELGAGNGNVAKAFLESEMPITKYTLCDLSPSRISGLRRNIADKRISIMVMDAERIPKSQHGKYDAVIMIALIEHLIDPLGSMQKIKKLLKPGGFVYIDTPNIAKFTRKITLLLGRFPSTASKNEGLTTYSNEPSDLYDEGHLHYFTYRSLSLMLMQRCGFSKVVKLGYPCGKMPLGKYAHHYLATIWPEMFSELAIIAYRDISS